MPNRVASWEETNLHRKQKNRISQHLEGKISDNDAIKRRKKVFKMLERERHSNTPNCFPMARWNHGSKQLNHSVETWQSQKGAIKCITASYKGSWERHSFRNDTRRTYQQWQAENFAYWKVDSTHYEIYKWVSRFVELAGSEEEEAFLLGHVYNATTGFVQTLKKSVDSKVSLYLGNVGTFNW